MHRRTLIFLTSLAFCGFTVTGVAWQSRQLRALRDEGRRLQQQLDTGRAAAAGLTGPDAATVVSPPSEELLRLRNQVFQLTQRERELAGVEVENQALLARATAASTNHTPLPATYIRKSQARNLGLATPEATIETFLWAYHNRDLAVLLSCYPPEAAATIQRNFENEEIFSRFPGLNVIGRRQLSEDRIEFIVELAPGRGSESTPLPMRRINGEWKMGP